VSYETRVIFEGEPPKGTKRPRVLSSPVKVVALQEDGLQHLSLLGTLTLCRIRTRYQAERPDLEPCPECAKLEQKLSPGKKPPQSKQDAAAAVPVRHGADAALPKRRNENKEVAPQLLKLAERLGRDPEELAQKIPADTLRRLKSPVLEHVTPDGTRRFEHDIKVRSGVRTTGAGA
jgi:hypothetical protein